MSTLLYAEQITPPAPAAPREAKVPQPAEKTLANGLRVIVVQKRNVPLVAAKLMVKTGGAADPAERAGLADTTASLLMKGTKKHDAQQIAEGTEALGATLDSGAEWDSSSVNLSVLSSKLPEALAYVADVVRNPTFQQEELDRLRDQNLDALRVALRQPQSLAGFVAARVLFGEGPYGHNLNGTPDSLQKITRADVERFHREHYTPDNAVLVFGGDVAPATAFALAEQLFGGWKSATEPSDNAKATIELKSPSAAMQPRVVVVDLPDAGQASVLAARQGIRRVDPLFIAAQVSNAVLGGGYSSRLNEEVRIKRGLSYGAGSNFDSRQLVGPFTAATQTKNESAAEVAGILVDELDRMATAPVPDTELTPRKAVLIGNFGRALETSAGLVGRIAALALYGLSLDEINHYIASVQSITASDVQKFAAAHLSGSDASIIIVGDAKKFLTPLQARFKNVEVIPVTELDIDSPTLRKKAK